MTQRAVTRVPPAVRLLLLLALVAQIGLSSFIQLDAEYRPLPPVPAVEIVHLGSLGEPELAARLLDLTLQAHDNQPGISLPFHQLDYGRVIDWLTLITRLDPRDSYPLLVASNVYTRVNDPQRLRLMLDFIEQEFRRHPEQNWRWLADAAITAKHRLGDLSLALRYANTLAENAGESVPYWAKDLRILILQEMGEKEAARILVSGLLNHGEITDPAELNFLTWKLQQLE